MRSPRKTPQRLVEVGVRVHEAGKQELVPAGDDIGVRRRFKPLTDPVDVPVPDEDVGGSSPERPDTPEQNRTHAPIAPRMTSTGAGSPVHSSNAAAPWATSTSRPLTTVAPARRAAAAVDVSG
jgi:hypothetical protein